MKTERRMEESTRADGSQPLIMSYGEQKYQRCLKLKKQRRPEDERYGKANSRWRVLSSVILSNRSRRPKQRS